jgi:hypothetical protein
MRGKRRLRQQQRELLAAQPAEDVTLTAFASQHVGKVLQHPVAGLVTEGVVHLLEEVEIDCQQAEVMVATAPACVFGRRQFEPPSP